MGGCTCHLVSHCIDIFYLLDGSSKLTRIITYFQNMITRKINNHFFYWILSISIHLLQKLKVLMKIIANHDLFSRTGKINNHLFSGKKWKNMNWLQPIYIQKIYRNIVAIPILKSDNVSWVGSQYLGRGISVTIWPKGWKMWQQLWKGVRIDGLFGKRDVTASYVEGFVRKR